MEPAVVAKGELVEIGLIVNAASVVGGMKEPLKLPVAIHTHL